MRTNKHNKVTITGTMAFLYESNVMRIEGLDYSEEECQKRFNICC